MTKSIKNAPPAAGPKPAPAGLKDWSGGGCPPTVWLVAGVAVGGQAMAIGGPAKSLKTSLALDLAVSVATGTAFLGRFSVPTRRRVAVFSGEGGEATVMESVERIGRAKGQAPKGGRLKLSFALPRLGAPSGRREFGEALASEGVEVAVIDPLHPCLFAGGPGTQSGNSLHDVGAVLAATAEACAAAGATLVVTHPTTKASAARPAGVPGPGDLAGAGVAEFVRQWLLIDRVSGFRPGSGAHELGLTVGGNAGHSSRWRVRVDEDPSDGTARKWSVAFPIPNGGGNPDWSALFADPSPGWG